MHGVHTTITAFLMLAAPAAGFAQPVTDHQIHLRSEAVTEAGEKWQEEVETVLANQLPTFYGED